MIDMTAPIFVNEDLLESLMNDVSEFGSTGDGGVDRPALTDDHKAARDWFCQQLKQRGYRVLIDEIGNVFGQIDLAGPEDPVVMIGSHLDSQPKGGRFDGAYGVMAALSVVESWREFVTRQGIKPHCNFVIADWMNEEGARFQPSLLGSSVFTGALDIEWALSRTDRDGKSVRSELERTGYQGSDRVPMPHCYLEVHIEGDTKMEKTGARIAPFVRHWGAIKVRIEVTGEQNHTGSTPMEERRDAMLGAAYIIAKVKELADISVETLYTSVARVDVSPNSPNIVPGKVVLFVELRAPEPDTLAWSEDALKKALPGLVEKAQVTAEILSTEYRPAGKFDTDLVQIAEAAADRFDYARIRLDTICGHDAIALNSVTPAIVIAVPSVNGVIHRHDEFTEFDDLLAGSHVLAEMVRQIDAARGSLSAAAEDS